MRYTKEDIQFNQISPQAFENLCYDIVVNMGFNSVIWRQGGADNGRDIEGTLVFNNSVQPMETKWFFECKHYSEGVGPEVLNSKIAWADAEQPYALVFFISSYLTNNARIWLDKMADASKYKIICWEGERIKDALVNHAELIERYFAVDRYDKLLKDIRDYKAKFGINPSFEFIREIIQNIDVKRLDEDDISFLLFSFYGQYGLLATRNAYIGDFDESIMHPLLSHMKESITHSVLQSFNQFVNDFSTLAGEGLVDEIYRGDETDIDNEQPLNFEYRELHLNHKQSDVNWRIGWYLFVIYQDVAFEVFKVDHTEIRIIRDFNPEKFTDLSINLPKDFAAEYNRYLSKFN